MFTLASLDRRSKVAAVMISIMLSTITVTGFVGGAMVPVSAASAATPAVIAVPLA